VPEGEVFQMESGLRFANTKARSALDGEFDEVHAKLHILIDIDICDRRNPRIVRKLVIPSGSFSRDGGLEWVCSAQLQDMPKELRDEYLAVAPRPENWRMQIFLWNLDRHNSSQAPPAPR
jgi:hypothetical protein